MENIFAPPDEGERNVFFYEFIICVLSLQYDDDDDSTFEIASLSMNKKWENKKIIHKNT